jgi:hypothetical protein
MDEKDIRMVNVLRAAYRARMQASPAPAFTPPAPSAAPSPLVVGGLTLIAQAVAQGKIPPNELMQRLRPWLPGYLRHAGVEEGRADDFLAFVVDHLGELGDRHFRDALPEWLAAFAGRAGAEITPEFTEAEAVFRVLNTSAEGEAPWTGAYRAYLRGLSLQRPADLLAAATPEGLKGQPFLAACQNHLYQAALRLHQQGLEDFEFASYAPAA